MKKKSAAPLCTSVRDCFARFARACANVMGSPWAFITSAILVVIWASTGKAFKFSDTWQLVINTTSSIVTFLMVFLIQNTQNRDSKAIHLKLDELIRAVEGARNDLVVVEEMSDEELDELFSQFVLLRQKAVAARERRSRKKIPAGNGAEKL